MTKRDPFDVEALLVDPEQVPRKPGRPKRWRRHYVQFPFDWIKPLLQEAEHGASAYALALLLAYEHWHQGGRPVTLSNTLAVEVGLLPRSKWNALAELERLQFIRVDRRAGRSPRVIVLLPAK